MKSEQDAKNTKGAARNEELAAIAELDRTVHSPARLMILAFLNAAESADFVFLMRETGLTRGNLSSHMSALENEGYIEVVKEFVDRRPLTLLKITKTGREAFQSYAEQMRGILETFAGE